MLYYVKQIMTDWHTMHDFFNHRGQNLIIAIGICFVNLQLHNRQQRDLATIKSGPINNCSTTVWRATRYDRFDP